MSEDKKAPTFESIKKKAQEHLAAMLATNKLVAEAEEYLKLQQIARFKKIAGLEKKKTVIENDIAVLRMEIAKDEAPTLGVIEKGESSLETAVKTIKALCYTIPVEMLKEKGLKIVDNDKDPKATITVNKTQTESIYEVGPLLEEYPGLESMSIDGDCPIVKAVDAAVLERLVDEEELPEDVYKYRTTVKVKNPGVKVTFNE